MNNQFKVKIPTGYLIVEEKGAETEYPGVIIRFSKDGETNDVSNIIACVEYNTYSEEIRTEAYRKDYKEPQYIIGYEDGTDLL